MDDNKTNRLRPYERGLLKQATFKLPVETLARLATVANTRKVTKAQVLREGIERSFELLNRES